IISFVTIITSYFICRKINKNEDEKQIHLNMLEQYKAVLDESSIVSKTDKDGLITYVNKKFEESCGYTNKELLGQSHNLLRHKSIPKEFFKSMWEKISVGLIWYDIIRNTNKNGESYYISTTIIPIKNKNGDIVEYISASNDITKLITTNNLLEKFALTDGLTGLGSRVKLMNDFKKDNVLAIVDIIKFTEVNDMYGQKIGDLIIKEVANEIFEFAKNYNIQTYRLHADVFALLSDTKNTNKFINQIKNLIRDLKEHHFDKDNVNTTFNFIAGISYGDGEVLACADMALKNAKRNHISVGVYSKDNNLLEEYKNNEKWMKVVTKALEDDRIVPYFQPIYSYKDSTVKKYEALMRLIDEDGTIVPPFNFLNVIKQTSIYPRVTQTMIRKTVDIFRYAPPNAFSINITLEDLLNTETMQYFYSIIASENLFERLIIEIVETEELVNFEKVSEILGEFKARGTKVAIDDFGTGYSNYNYLRKLDVDFIKIDGSIIKNIEDSKTKELVSTILDFAKKSDMQTIAEFVSSKEIDKSVQELGVDFAQGYFRGKPSPSI
ncbi:EAL domain-containing protein, partial [Sulfurospirillum sp.]|nr:EAL domain-containing protein [Sulfurospirillum sp.]